MDETTTPAPDPPKPARWKKVLLYGGGGLLLLLGILAVLLPTILSSGAVRGMAEEKGSAAAGRRVTIGSLDVGWSATVVKDLVVRAGPGEGDPVLARVGEIRVPAGITLAFASRYDVGEIEILRPEVRIDLRELAKPAPEKAPKPAKTPGAGVVIVSKKEDHPLPPFAAKVKVREGSLVLVDLAGKERRLGAFSADLAAASDGPAEVAFTLDAGPGGKATFRGKTSPFRDGRLLPTEALEAAVGAAFDAFDPGLDEFKGVVSGTFSGTASGDGSVRDGKVLLDVRGLSMKGAEEPEIHLEGAFSRTKDGGAEVREGVLRMKGLDASGSATLLPSGAVNGSAHATAALDLLAARAKRAGVPFDGYLVGDLVLDARAVSDGRGDRLTGTFGVSGGQVAFGPNSPPIDEPEVRAEFDLTREGRKWTVGVLALKSATADLSLSGTAMQDLSSADLRARAKARLGPLLRIAKAFGTPLPGEISGDLDLDATLRRTGKEGDLAKGTLVVTDLVVLPPGEGAQPVREARLEAAFEAVPGKESLEVRRLTWKGAGAEVRLAGTASMDGKSGEFSGCQADLDLGKAAALAAAFGSPLPAGLAGTASWGGPVSWKESFGSATATGTLALRNLAVALPGDRVLREPEVRVGVDATAKRAGTGFDLALRGATLAANGIDLSALGTAAADGTLDLAVKGTASIAEALRRAAGTGFLAKDPGTRGTVAFDLGVKGKPGALRAEVRQFEARDAEFELRATGAVEEQGTADLALEGSGDLAVLLDLAARAGLLEPVKGAAGKGFLRGTVKAAGPGTPLRLALVGGVEGLAYPDPSGGPPWTQKGVKASLAFDMDRTSRSASGSADLRADDGGIVITGSLDLAEGKRRLDAKGDVDFDAGGFCRSRPDLLPLPDMTVGRVKGGLVVKAPLDTPFDLAKVEGGARLVLDSVKTEPVELKDASVDLFLRNGALEARTIAGTVNGGKVAGSAGLGLSGEAPKHFLDLHGEGIRIDPAMNFLLKRAVPLFVVGDGGGVEGTVTFALRLDGTGKEWLEAKKTLAGKGSLTVTDGSVRQSGILGDILELLDGGKGLSFSSLTTEFLVHDRRVWNDRLLLDGKEHALVVSGSTAFNGEMDYRIGAKGLRLPKKTLERIQPLLDAEGNLPFTLKGNFAKPKVKGPDLKKAIKGLLGGKDD